MAQSAITIIGTNISAQVGDYLMCSCTDGQLDGFNVVTEPFVLGTIEEIIPNSAITVDTNGDNILDPYFPGRTTIAWEWQSTLANSGIGKCRGGIFLGFVKDCKANIADLVGYYAEAKFVNNDFKEFCELFSVNSQVSVSSK